MAVNLYMEQQPDGRWYRVKCHDFKYTKKIVRDIGIDYNRKGMTRTVQIPQPSV